MISLYEKYKKVKDSLMLDYHGYPIHNILSVDIIALVYKKKRFRLNQFLDVFLIKKISIYNESEILFSIGNYNRKDYYEILDYIRNDDIQNDLLDLSTLKRRPCISIKNIIISLQHVFFNNVKLDFLSKLSLFTTMVFSLNTIDYLDKQNSNVKVFCSFCSNLNDEAILDYFFQKRGVPTYTLQHGLWFIYDCPPIDAITYENLVANKLLCWGEYTKDEFIKFGIDENRLIVAGYPKKVNKLTTKKINNGKQKVLVLLSRRLFDNNNMELMLLLCQAKSTLDIYLKLHPSLDVNKYAELANAYGFSMTHDATIKELLQSNFYDFSVSYNSTAYYDSYINNHISLRYKDRDSDNAESILNDSFENVDELIDKLQLIHLGQYQQSIWIEIQDKLKYILGYGINKYDSLQG